ncbi:DUF6348 family protein [Kitasatospora sp. NPDC059571]|uniref:DUF6348 family protein n=1 Tax=Kitasatospora sp. NPDC059571 TaxID=3346871 RepID=UPI00368EE6AE
MTATATRTTGPAAATAAANRTALAAAFGALHAGGGPRGRAGRGTPGPTGLSHPAEQAHALLAALGMLPSGDPGPAAIPPAVRRAADPLTALLRSAGVRHRPVTLPTRPVGPPHPPPAGGPRRGGRRRPGAAPAGPGRVRCAAAARTATVCAMGLGSWWRGASAAGRGPQDGAAGRLSDEAVLAVVAEQLSEISGERWTVADGCAKGPGTAAVAVAAPHAGGPAHLDLTYLVDAGRPEETAVTDCVAGFGADSRAAVRQAVEIWASTTGVTMLELLAHNGRFAGHLHPSDPDGLPGWHAIHGGIVGWGSGERHNAVQDWTLARPLLPQLAPALADGFDRDGLVGLTIELGGRAGAESAEVRVGGVVHEQASKALLALDWPRVAEGEAHARTFVLLVRPER